MEEIKKCFFANYLGQKIAKHKGKNLIDPVKNCNPYDVHLIDYLLLKPLSSISDEDAIELEKMSYRSIEWQESVGEEYLIREGKELAKSIEAKNFSHLYQIHGCCEIIDYLRSKGYALPWRGVSVEDQVKSGWIKLTSNP